MAWAARDIPELDGRIAVVTGANGGLGLATAVELARHGARVVMAARDPTKTSEAHAAILAQVPDARLEVQPLDLASLESIKTCASAIAGRHQQVHILVNNAGIMAIPRRETTDGFEMQLGVNHLGHFALTCHLLPALARAEHARVVSVTSFARLIGTPVSPANPHLDRRYETWSAYGRSKLANMHFAAELHRRLRAAGLPIASLAAHPGLTNTDLQARSVRETPGGFGQRFWHFAARNAGMPVELGALSQLRAATDPKARSGELYGPVWGAFGPPVRRPVLWWSGSRRAARRLWELSEAQTGSRFELTDIPR